MKKTSKKLLGLALVLVMVLGLIPTTLQKAQAEKLGDHLEYYHNSNDWGSPKVITEADGSSHWVYCINPNQNADSNYSYQGESGNWRNKYSVEEDGNISPALAHNTQGGGNRMTGTQDDRDFLASIVIHGEENGYSYSDIQDAVTDAVYNRKDKTGGGNALYEYAKANTLSSEEYSLYLYAHDQHSTFQSLIWAELKGGDELPETVDITVIKKWIESDGTTVTTAPEGASVCFQLKADDNAVAGQVATITAANDWTVTFTNQPKYQADGETAIVYSIEEVAFTGEGFEAGSVTRISDTDWIFEAVNAKTPEEPDTKLITVKVIKKWIGDAPESLSVQLQKDGVNENKAVTLNKENNWTHTWTDLEAGHVYSIAEPNMSNYSVTKYEAIPDVDGNLTITIENTKTSEEPEKVEVEISKVDAADTTKELPGALLIIENADGEIVAQWTSTTEIHKVKLVPGTYTLTEISAPKGYEVAESITFTVTETGVEGGKVVMKDEATPEETEPTTEPSTEPEETEPTTEPSTEPEETEPTTEPSTEPEETEHTTEPSTEPEETEPTTEEVPTEPVEEETVPGDEEPTTSPDDEPTIPPDDDESVPHGSDEETTSVNPGSETPAETTTPGGDVPPTEPSATVPGTVPPTTPGSTPPMGDNSHSVIFAVILSVSALACAWLVGIRKKVEEN